MRATVLLEIYPHVGRKAPETTHDPVHFVFKEACIDLNVVIGLIHVEAHAHVHWLVLVVVGVSSVYGPLSVEAGLVLFLLEVLVLLVTFLVARLDVCLLARVLTSQMILLHVLGLHGLVIWVLLGVLVLLYVILLLIRLLRWLFLFVFFALEAQDLLVVDLIC